MGNDYLPEFKLNGLPDDDDQFEIVFSAGGEQLTAVLERTTGQIHAVISSNTNEPIEISHDLQTMITEMARRALNQDGDQTENDLSQEKIIKERLSELGDYVRALASYLYERNDAELNLLLDYDSLDAIAEASGALQSFEGKIDIEQLDHALSLLINGVDGFGKVGQENRVSESSDSLEAVMRCLQGTHEVIDRVISSFGDTKKFQPHQSALLQLQKNISDTTSWISRKNAALTGY